NVCFQKEMNVAYFVPHLNTNYAGRTIYKAYENAFKDLGHNFTFITSSDNQEEIYNKFQPDLLITGLNSYIFRFLDLDLLKNQKKTGMKVFVNVPFWTSPLAKSRINETPSLKDNEDWVKLIKSGEYGDVYFNP